MDVFEKRGKSLLTGVKICVLLMLLGFFAYVFLFESPVPLSKLKKLSVGMTTSQVKEILGSPTDDLGRVSNGSGTLTHSWEFERSLHLKTVWVFFDNDDHYAGFRIENGGM
jgi:hypothetical protein